MFDPKKMISRLFPFLLFTACHLQGQISVGQLKEKVDALVARAESELIPGSAVLVVKDGNIILNEGYGYANIEHQVSIGPETLFDLASVSKQFAGFAVAKLIDEGKIHLQDDIRQYIPELPFFGTIITIDHLLHHTSGLRDWTATLPLAGWSFEDVISFDQILNMTYRQEELNFLPGAEYSYSNTGYNLLAELVQRVTGKSFSDWTREHIFLPLGMEQTQFLDEHNRILPNRATGYFRGNSGAFHAKPNLLTALGSSSLYSTTTDLAKWVINLDQPKSGMKSILQRMYQKGKLNDGEEISYAFGLSISEYRGTKRIAHSGSWASFRTYLAYFPEHHLSVVVLNNHPRSASRIALDIAGMLLPEQKESTSSTNEEGVEEPSGDVRVSTQMLDNYVGTYRLGPGWYVNITRKEGQLWTQATNENNFPMTTLGKSLFRIDAYGRRTMDFLRDGLGHVTHVKYNDILYPRVETLSSPSRSQLQLYTGIYESTELATTYEIAVEGNSLSLIHHRLGRMKLSHAWKEDFSGDRWFVNSVEFTRAGNGNVTGFNVTTGRARNQRFIKVK